MVGGVPPWVPPPPPRTLPVLAALSSLTGADLPDLAVAVQRRDLAGRRLAAVAVVEAVGCDGLVLQTQQSAVELAVRTGSASADWMSHLDADRLLHRVQRVTEDLTLRVAG